MSDLDQLHELADQLRPPAFDDLAAVARKRRRRSALAAVAGTAVVVAGVILGGAVLFGGERAFLLPEDQAASPSTADEWSPQRIRAEGSPAENMTNYGPGGGATASGLETQVYCVGGVRRCDWYDQEQPSHWALEVQEGERSAVFEVDGRPWMSVFEGDSILVQDGPAGAPRYRLLRADGAADQLRLGSDGAPARAGPDVLRIPDLEAHRRGMIGPGTDKVFRVDDRAGTIERLEVPSLTWWGPNVEEFLWGGDECAVRWQRADGSFARHDLDCLASTWTPGMNWEGFEDWLEPGRMALVEYRDATNGETVPLIVHVSLDYGATWRRIKVDTEDPYAVEGVLGPLG